MVDGRGRKCLLTKRRTAALLEALREGNYPTVAARLAGIAYSTLSGWLTQGERALELGQRTSKYAVFLTRALEAMGQGEEEALQALRNGATGNSWTRRSVTTTTRRVLDEHGNEVEETETTVVEVFQRDWRAAAWYLDRRHQARWRPKTDVEEAKDEYIKHLVLSGPDPALVLPEAPPKRTIEHKPKPKKGGK